MGIGELYHGFIDLLTAGRISNLETEVARLRDKPCATKAKAQAKKTVKKKAVAKRSSARKK